MKTINFNQSFKNLVNNLKGLFILSLALTTFGVGNAWGEYYVLQNQGTSSVELMNGWSSSTDKSYTLTGPGAQLSFEVEKVNDGMFGATGNITVTAGSTTIQTIKMSDLSKKNTWYKYSVDLTKYDNYKTNRSITFSASGTLAKYLRSAQVTMAQYLEDPSSTAEMAWGAGKVDDANVTKSITIAWCNVPALSYSVTGTGKEQVSVVIENNSEYGKYNTATVKVTYNRNAASTLDATLTIKNDYNSYSKSIKLSGSTTKYDQSLSWVNESSIEPNMMVGATPTIKAISDQGQTVTYTSSNSDVLSVDADGKLTANSVGEATITASQGGNYKYNAATSISKTFQVKTKDTPIFTPNWSSTNLKVGDKVTLGVQYVSDGLNGEFKAKDYDSNILNVTRNGNTITIEALNEGSSSVTFAQTETDAIFSTSKTYSFNVSKIANTLTADAAHSMKVDESWMGVISGKNSDGTITTESTDASIAYFDVANNKIVAQNTNNQSFNSKVVTITISQAATYKYTAAEKTITVTVNKHIPTFTWSNATLYHNQSYNDFFTTNGTNALTVKSSSDDNVAYLVDGSNAQKLNLKTLTKAASTTLTVTQAENYYWAEHTEQKTITPGYQSNHVSFTITNANHSTFENGSSSDCQWDGSSYKMCDGGWSSQTDYVILHFTGIPDKLTFDKSNEKSLGQLPGTSDFKVYESSNGTSWGDAIWTRGDKEESYSASVQLSPTTQYIKLEYHGTVYAHWKNITVTELKTFSTDKSELDFGNTNKKDMPCDPKTFTFNYANVGHKVTLSTSDNHFSVSPTSITNIGGEKYGSQTITVSYRTDEVHSATNAKLTISDELGNSKEVTLKGTTTKKAQTLTWEKPYDVAEPAIPIGKTITGAATSSAISLDITYESSDETIIEIVDDGKAFKAVKEGSATITAKQIGTDDWEQASISKLFKTTNKIIQVISWNQNFTRLLTTYGAQDLTATVYLEDAQTGVQTWSKERSDLITYTSQNSSVVSVYGSKLNIIDKGSTTLTASVPGDDLYESATVTIPVTVRDPSAGCEDVLLTTDLSNSEYEFHRDLDTKEITKIVQIDRTSTAYPGAVTFQHRGKKSWGYYDGEIEVYESVDGGANYNTLVGHVKPNESSEYGISTFSINRNTTHLKFYRPAGSTGYHYIKNVEIIPAQFIESNAINNTIDFGNVTVYSVEERTVTLSYANVKDNLTITKSSSNIALSCGDIIDLDCGATGTNTITITFTPTAVGDFSDDITFFDKNSKKNYTLNIKAKVVRSTQHITWEPTQTEYRTIDQIVLNAIATSAYPVKYYVKEGTDVADFVNGVLTIKKDGQITIRAYEPGDAIYEAAADVDKTFTIRKTNLHYDPLPTAATITYPQTLSESNLTDGIVKDEDGNVVAGTIAWTNPTAQLNAGENQTQGITFTPTNNPAWYNALSSTTTVSVLKATSTATPSAANIPYGSAVNTSELTNEGTSGTWTWTDSRKDDVLNVGTYDGLAVHFTPSSNNYNELDATVSLTVTKADAQLTWTTAPTDVEISEAVTYMATSNHSESAITYSITAGGEYATIDASTGVLNMLKAGTITVQAAQAATDNYNAATTSTTTTITGQLENKFTNAAGDNDWQNPDNWTNGVPSETNPDVIIAGEVTIDEPISVDGLTIEENGKVTVIDDGSLSVNGTSAERDTYGNLFIKNGGDVTIATEGNVRVNDFVIESSIGTDGISESGQITNADKVLYVNGAYIDINLDPSGKANDKQWYGFTVPFPVDIHNGVARKEGDIFRKLTYNNEYVIAEYDMNQRLNSGKGWKYITTSQLQPGRFYYITFDGDYNTYSFKAATNTITTSYKTSLTTNGTGANANWNAVGNSALRHVTASYGATDDETFVQVYQNGLSQYKTVRTDDATFVVGCPFFVQAQENTVLQLTDAATDHANNTYAPLRNATKANRSIKLVIAPENGGYSDQVYMRTTTDVKSEYIIGRDLAKAGVGTASVQMWINAYGQQLSVNEVAIEGEEAIFPLGIYAPKAGGYRLTIDETDTPTYLMENNVVIWDFANGSYVVDLSKGTNNDYSIVRTMPNSPSEATDFYSVQQNNQSINKVIFRNKMYIINNAHTYDAQGQTIR